MDGLLAFARWGLGIVFLISGVGGVARGDAGGLGLLAIALLLFPAFTAFLRTRFGIALKPAEVFGYGVLMFLLSPFGRATLLGIAWLGYQLFRKAKKSGNGARGVPLSTASPYQAPDARREPVLISGEPVHDRPKNGTQPGALPPSPPSQLNEKTELSAVKSVPQPMVSAASPFQDQVNESPRKENAPVMRVSSFTVSIGDSSGGYVPASSLTADPEALWRPPGQPVAVGPYLLADGMVYVGEKLANVRQWGVERALINPKLPINAARPDTSGSTLGYYTGYADLEPGARAAYLAWLAGGRKDPDIAIGYVFLFYCGLERRLLADTRHSERARAETPQLLAEIERLLVVFGEHPAFNSYASRLLDHLHAIRAADKLYRLPLPAPHLSGLLSFRLKAALGQMAQDGVPLNAEWAIAWVRSYGGLRTPANRCASEFDALFALRFGERFRNGIALRVNKTPLRPDYHAANQGIEVTFDAASPLAGLPDVMAVKQPFARLRELAETCEAALDAYSRYVGRHPDTPYAVAGLLLLPRELYAVVEPVKAITAWLGGRLGGGGRVAVPVRDFSAQILSHRENGPVAIDRKEWLASAQLLQALGFGMEPDPRFGGGLPECDGQMVLFTLAADAAEAPGSDYLAAAALLQLGMAVAQADGAVNVFEREHLYGLITSWAHLPAPEHVRLSARLDYLAGLSSQKLPAKKQLESLPSAAVIAERMLRLAQSDGTINPEEMRVLTRVYQLFGIRESELFSAAHQAAVSPGGASGVDEPVVMQPAAPAAGFTIPAKPKPRPAGAILDLDSVRAKIAETEAVSSMLEDIFVDEEAAPVVQEVSVDENVIGSLDTAHSDLLRLLVTRPAWTRSELEGIARDRNLMLDGALDLLNETAFDLFDEPLFEDGDPVEINQNIIKELAE